MNEVTAISSASVAGPEDAFTAREFMRLVGHGAFAGIKAELIDGVIFKVAPAHIERSLQNAALTATLINLLAGLDLRVGVDLVVLIYDRTLLGIDIAVVNASAPESGAVSGAHVDLAVEIAATSLAKDLGVKAGKYASASIMNYWIVDLKASVTHVMTDPQAGGYSERKVVRFGEPLAVPGTGATIRVG